jgi:hypothetical protein
MKEGNFTINKTTVECYKIRHSTNSYWADITVDANESTGRIQIASDFGSWERYWGACGKSFKEFLIHLNIDYAADKFGQDKWFDEAATIKQFKREVIEYRRNDSITSEIARKIWNEIKELEEIGPYENEFSISISQCDELMRFNDYCPHLIRVISPLFRRFWNEIWPVFIEELKKEI